MDESGWLIEHKDSEVHSPQYWSAIAAAAGKDGWHASHDLATRFAREEDATAVSTLIFGKGHGHRICEHGWG